MDLLFFLLLLLIPFGFTIAVWDFALGRVDRSRWSFALVSSYWAAVFYSIAQALSWLRLEKIIKPNGVVHVEEFVSGPSAVLYLVILGFFPFFALLLAKYFRSEKGVTCAMVNFGRTVAGSDWGEIGEKIGGLYAQIRMRDTGTHWRGFVYYVPEHTSGHLVLYDAYEYVEGGSDKPGEWLQLGGEFLTLPVSDIAWIITLGKEAKS